MLGKTNAISPAGAELVTGTIIGPSGFTPVQTLVYSDGQQALYVDVTRGSQKLSKFKKYHPFRKHLRQCFWEWQFPRWERTI